MVKLLSPDNTLRLGVIGAGYIANYHIDILNSLKSVRILACCDVSLQRAESLRAKWSIPRSYDKVDQFLDENSLDVVHVLVPPAYHYSVAKQVLEHKIHVLLEKPMCVTSDQCSELIELAKENKVKIGVNHNAIYHPLFLRLQTDISQGRIGEVDHVVAFQGGPLGQLDAGMFGHWMFREPKNVLLEQAPHPISQVRALLGEIQDIQATVSGGRDLGHNQLFYDRWQAIARCENGSALLHLSFGKKYHLQSWINVSGQDGSIRVDLLNNLYLVQKKSVFPDYLDPWANAMAYSQGVKQGFANFADYVFSKLKVRGKSDAFYLGMRNSLEAFYASLSRNENPPVSGEDGKKVIEFCERWIEAARPKQNPGPVEIKSSEAIGNARILITGAAGFIGRHLVEQLVARNLPVRVLVRNTLGLPASFYSALVEVVRGDICDANQVEKAMQGIQFVFHLAHSVGQTWSDFERVNVIGTRALAEASLRAGVKYFVFTSTIAAYYTGDLRGSKVDEQTPIDPKPLRRNFYARSKIMLEHMLMQMYRNEKLPLIIFRPAIVIGKGGIPYHGGVGEWTRDNVCTYWGMGNNALPFVLVDDVVSALVKVMETDNLGGEIFNLAGDVRFSARQYIEYLKQYSGRNISAFRYPMIMWFLSDVFKYMIKLATGEHKNALLSYRDLRNRSILADFDNSKAKTLLKWQPNKNTEEFIRKGIGWAFKEE